jgi:RNA polymerase sigma-70 factor (ECF subfamily)
VTDDADLVVRLKKGNVRAFDEVYAAYRPRLFSFLLRLSGRRDLAEDLLQETFIKLARSAPSLTDDTNLRAWLFTVARNAFVSHRRWAMLDVSRLLAFGADRASLAPRTPDEETEAARTVARLERALAELPGSSREVLLLVGVEGMEQEEVAAILGIKYEALRQRLSRARAQLADKIETLEKARHARRGAEERGTS